jgi:hypothetical protein
MRKENGETQWLEQVNQSAARQAASLLPSRWLAELMKVSTTKQSARRFGLNKGLSAITTSVGETIVIRSDSAGAATVGQVGLSAGSITRMQ